MFLRPLSSIRKTITFRLIVWYSAFFILSTSFLFLLAYFLLASSVRQKDREETHEKLDEYAAQYRSGGISALKNEVGLEEKSGKGERLFVRVVGPQGQTLFLNDPDRWKNLEVNQGTSVPSSNDQPITMRTAHGGDQLEVDSMPLPDGNILQVGQSTEE